MVWPQRHGGTKLFGGLDTELEGARKDAKARSVLVIWPERQEGTKFFGGLDTELEGARKDAKARSFLVLATKARRHKVFMD